MEMSGALAPATRQIGFTSAVVVDCCDSPSVLTAVGSDDEMPFGSFGKNIIKHTTNTAMPATDAMAHLGIDDFGFSLAVTCGADC